MFAAAVSFAVLAAAAVSAQVTVYTPSTPVFCQPTLISWTGGTAPYYLTVNEGGSTSNILENLVSGTTETSYTWIVDIAAGTPITIAVKDATGAQNYAQELTVAENPTGLTTCDAADDAGQSSAAAEASTATATLTTGVTGAIPVATGSAAVSSIIASASSIISSVSAAAGDEDSSSTLASVVSSVSESVATTVTRSQTVSTDTIRSTGAAASSLTSLASSAAAAASSVTTSAGGLAKSASFVTFGLVAVGSIALLI